jgi:hypothetical protein
VSELQGISQALIEHAEHFGDLSEAIRLFTPYLSR